MHRPFIEVKPEGGAERAFFEGCQAIVEAPLAEAVFLALFASLSAGPNDAHGLHVFFPVLILANRTQLKMTVEIGLTGAGGVL